MTDLTASEVVQVLNRLTPDGTVYCLDEGVPGVDVEIREVEDGPVHPDRLVIYAAVKVEGREGLYRIAERLRLDEAVKRISVVLSMELVSEA